MPPKLTGVWEIIGYDGTSEIFRASVSVGTITASQLHALLRALAAKHGLTSEELVPCFLKRNAKLYRPHLEVRAHNDDKRRTTYYSCGDNPHFLARVRRIP